MTASYILHTVRWGRWRTGMQIFNIQVLDYLGFTSKISFVRTLITVPDSRKQYCSCHTVRRLFDLLTEEHTHENNCSFRRETNERKNICLIHNVSVCHPSCYVSRMLLNSVAVSCRKDYCPQNRKYSASTMIGWCCFHLEKVQICRLYYFLPVTLF